MRGASNDCEEPRLAIVSMLHAVSPQCRWYHARQRVSDIYTGQSASRLALIIVYGPAEGHGGEAAFDGVLIYIDLASRAKSADDRY